MPDENDREKGREVASQLRALNARGILVQSAEEGYITSLSCQMPDCLCPEEAGGRSYFEPVTSELSDWIPTHEHYPRALRDGGKRTLDNSLLAHRLCNRIDYSKAIGRAHAKDLQRVERTRALALEGKLLGKRYDELH